MIVLKTIFRNYKFISRSTTMAFQRPSSSCTKLIFREFGEPLKVLKLEEELLPPPTADEVLVKFIVASVNPADINLIQGVYPVKIELPTVGGLEGVGEVVEVGSNVNGFKPGDWVIPNKQALGTWRTRGNFKPEILFKVPNDINAVELAGLSSNPCTAYRMLKDFVNLNAGDVVIQNGGNSACGQNIIQICRINNFISVNIVRDRPEIDQLKSYLKSLGADYVLTEDELRKTDLFKANKIPRPKLALNCVGGKSSTEISRQLANHGVMVSYGGMSREPVTVPTSAFIFKEISLRGFWMTRWTQQNGESAQRQEMFDELCEYMRYGKLKAPEHKLVPLKNFSEAIMKSSSVQGYTGCKYLIDCQNLN